MSSMRSKAIGAIRVGDNFTVSRTFTEREANDFAVISRDFNPVHLDDRFAGAKNLKGKICHGLLVGSMLTEIGGQLGWLATEMNFRFIEPVYFGDTIECDLIVKAVDDRGQASADAIFRNEDGTTVLEAHVKGMIPGEPEKQVILQMISEGDPTNKIGISREEEERAE
jgi:3-hydroxybutyryl-CoA dehydratase